MNSRLLGFTVVLCLYSVGAKAQLNTWVSQNPSNISGSYRAVQMISGTTTYIVGDNGAFTKTTDAGTTFVTTLLGSKPLYALSFRDSLNGMVVGGAGGAFKTTDAGKNWKPMNTGSSQDLLGVLMVDSKIALACGSGNTLVLTHDGGVTWKPFSTEFTIGSIRGLRMLDPNFIVMVGDNGSIYLSRDTAKSFVQFQIVNSNEIYDVCFVDSLHGTAVGPGGRYIIGTSDGGLTWQHRDTDNFSFAATLNSIDMKNSSDGVAVGDGGTVIYTTDGGHTWTKTYIGLQSSLRGISMLNKDSGIAVGADGVIIRTTDAGLSWEFLPRRPQTSILRTIKMFANLTTGIAAGGLGTILRTIDGGKHWNPVSSSADQNLYSSAYTGDSTGLIVGDNGTIIRTTDAGATWTQQSSHTSKHLKASAFPSPMIAYAAGDSSVFLKSPNGGTLWVNYTAPTDPGVGVTSLSFHDELLGVLSSPQGIYKTTNGGLSWKLVLAADTYLVTKVSFGKYPTRIYATCVEITNFYTPGVLYSRDAGETWQLTNATASSNALASVFTDDGFHATAIGRRGLIIHITDVSDNWLEQPTPTSNDLYDVSFGSTKAGFSCGYRGTILRIDTDEEEDVRNPAASSSARLKIERIYPNPAADRIRVTFSLDRDAPTTLTIFDIHGVRVAAFDEGYQSSGEHSADLNLPHMASGSYLVQISGGGAIATANLSVVR